MDLPRPHGETIRTLGEIPQDEVDYDSCEHQDRPGPEATQDDHV
ncbi:MAG: hypothetical protein ACTHZK_10460 [Arthrobacter sp.]